jgi:hypothetical protein
MSDFAMYFLGTSCVIALLWLTFWMFGGDE